MLFVRIILLIILLLTIIYLYSIAPRKSRQSKYELLLKYYYAHRGLFSNKKGIPENSLKAFRRALDKGYGIELDVHVTADNIPIVFHDNTLDRMCGITGTIEHMTYEEIKPLKLLNTNEHIPLLDEVLTLVNGQVPLLIELKSESKAKPVCKAANNILAMYNGTYFIQSFNPLVLKWYRKKRPDIVRGQLSGGIFRSSPENNFFVNILLNYLLLNFLSKPDFISYSHKDSDNLSLKINQIFFKTMTFVWTIKNIDDYNKCINNFDGVIFDSFIPPVP